MIALQASPPIISSISQLNVVEITFKVGVSVVPKFSERIVWWMICETNLIFLPRILAGHEVRRGEEVNAEDLTREGCKRR